MSQLAPHAVRSVNELNFQQEVLESTLPVLIDFSTTWCPPCKVARPVVHELAMKHSGMLKVVEIDGDESPRLASELGVRGFPTFIALAHGQVVDRQLGFSGRKRLEELACALLPR